jgi:DNA-binding GntR family transcriptional regulator
MTSSMPLAAVRTDKAPSQRHMASAVTLHVINGLETGEYVPGQRLVEADLCLRSGAGRQPVRIALQALSGLGIVDLAANRGATIVRMTVDEARKTLDVTEMLLELAARSAAQNVAKGHVAAGRVAEQGEMARLASAVAVLERMLAEDAREAFGAARREIYAALGDAADNSELLRLIKQVRVHVLRAQFGFAALWRVHAEELRDVGRAVLDGDAARASALSHAHVRGVKQHLEGF